MSDDLISRNELKKHKFTTQVANGVELEDIEVVPLCVIDNAPPVEAYPYEQVQELVKLNQQFAQEIENLKRPTGEWIPVSERLPDENGFYLCTFTFDNGNFIEVAQIYYDKILKIFGHGSNKYTVIAWMPLPKAYKEEADDEQ